MTRPSRARTANRGTAARQWLTWLALFAFFLQGLAVQTHIHPADSATLAKLAVHSTAPLAPTKSQDSGDQCRLCQELVHAGAFVTPSAALWVAPLGLVRAIPLALLPPRGQSAPAFTWQSRAPPRR